ncbi:hypothetical protein CYY_004430 [Polysphondylium violaceum]|uniref:BRCT domain-containing protein n=1 Tax=Polysphondylium violaceum TaxID=133409 RepID=A0A8J4PVE3_9MYCE|nr:hypothetical protein CYY_004430 [Polysphondylium violaceum]
MDTLQATIEDSSSATLTSSVDDPTITATLQNNDVFKKPPLKHLSTAKIVSPSFLSDNFDDSFNEDNNTDHHHHTTRLNNNNKRSNSGSSNATLDPNTSSSTTLDFNHSSSMTLASATVTTTTYNNNNTIEHSSTIEPTLNHDLIKKSKIMQEPEFSFSADTSSSSFSPLSDIKTIQPLSTLTLVPDQINHRMPISTTTTTPYDPNTKTNNNSDNSNKDDDKNDVTKTKITPPTSFSKKELVEPSFTSDSEDENTKEIDSYHENKMYINNNNDEKQDINNNKTILDELMEPNQNESSVNSLEIPFEDKNQFKSANDKEQHFYSYQEKNKNKRKTQINTVIKKTPLDDDDSKLDDFIDAKSTKAIKKSKLNDTTSNAVGFDLDDPPPEPFKQTNRKIILEKEKEKKPTTTGKIITTATITKGKFANKEKEMKKKKETPKPVAEKKVVKKRKGKYVDNGSLESFIEGDSQSDNDYFSQSDIESIDQTESESENYNKKKNNNKIIQSEQESDQESDQESSEEETSPIKKRVLPTRRRVFPVERVEETEIKTQQEEEESESESSFLDSDSTDDGIERTSVEIPLKSDQKRQLALKKERTPSKPKTPSKKPSKLVPLKFEKQEEETDEDKTEPLVSDQDDIEIEEYIEEDGTITKIERFSETKPKAPKKEKTLKKTKKGFKADEDDNEDDEQDKQEEEYEEENQYEEDEEEKEIITKNKKPKKEQKSQTFKGFSFIICNIPQKDSDPNCIYKLIKNNGGKLLDPELFFSMNEYPKATIQGKKVISWLLISSGCVSSIKYLKAVITKTPCVKDTWIHDCIEKDQLLFYYDYLLPSGQVLSTNKLVTLKNPIFHNLFEGLRFEIVTKDKEFKDGWNFIIKNCGGKIVQRLYLEAGKIDILLGDGKPITSFVIHYVKTNKTPFVSPRWVIQSILEQKRLDYDVHAIKFE